jgi:hypothetical protein
MEYITLDINPDCIAYAQRTYDTRGLSFCANRNWFAGIAIYMTDESKVDA